LKHKKQIQRCQVLDISYGVSPEVAAQEARLHPLQLLNTSEALVILFLIEYPRKSPSK
jgi:hypothetical protein